MTSPHTGPHTGPHDGAVPLRASDADRERTVAALRHAAGEGRLTLAEADERITAAYAAVHQADLAPLTADLPTPSPAAPSPAAPSPVARPPLPAVLGMLAVLAWIASPLPFPWPLLLITLLVLLHRGRYHRGERHSRPA